MICKESVRAHFSKNASQYSQYAHVQKIMANTLWRQVKPYLKPGMKVLEIGCGTGYLTELMIQSSYSIAVTAVDIAPGMIEVSKQKFASTESIQWICGDIEEMALSNTYDLIVSNATFQWFNTPEKTVNRLSTFLNDEGILGFSTFGPDTFIELHQAFKRAEMLTGIENQQPPGQSFFSLESYKDFCQKSEIQVYGEERIEMEYFRNARAFLDSVRRIGANNSNQNRSVKSPTLMKTMLRCYDSMFRETDLVQATYHCIYCIGQKQSRG